MYLLNLLYFILILLLLPFSPKYLLKKQYRQLMKKRLFPERLPEKASGKKRIWIQAVSVGEVRSINSLLLEFKKIADIEIVLSVTTPTGYRIAKSQYPDIPLLMSPLDFSFTVKRFLKRISPDLLLLNELEIWPNWIAITHRRRIPIMVINGRISTDAMKRYVAFKWMFKSILNKIDQLLVQGEIYRERFIQLGVLPGKIKKCGNIKADEAGHARQDLVPIDQIYSHLKITSPDYPVIACASTHPSDEAVILPAISRLQEKYGFILVPRHPDRLNEIIKTLELAEIPYQIWSKTDQADLSKSLLIYDRIGYLFNIQAISDLVIMGGSFEQKIGGHNLYEPAILGKRIIGGPCYNNFPEIGDSLIKADIYSQVTDSDEMANEINRCIEADPVLSARAESIVRERKGSVTCILESIGEIL